MTRISELPEISVLADDDFVTAIDVSDMSESPTGKNVKIQKQNLLAGPTVQSAHFSGAAPGAVPWSSETGWAITRDAAGTYTITFPTTAANAESQSITCTPRLTSPTDSAARYTLTVQNTSATGCKVYTHNTSGALEDYDFDMVRIT